MSQRQQSPSANGESKANHQNGKTPRRRRGGRRGRGGSDALPSPLASDGAENVIDALFDLDGLDADVIKLFRAELARAHGLGNLDEAHLNYRKYKILNTEEFWQAAFPPQESIWQGELRKEAGLKDGREALTPELAAEIRTAADATYNIATRSGPEFGGFQQKLLAQQQAERREIVERDDKSSGGWLKRILG